MINCPVCGHEIETKGSEVECPWCFMIYEFSKDGKIICENYSLKYQQKAKKDIEDSYVGKKKNILCLLGIHNWVNFLIAPYACAPKMCYKCGEKKDNE